jgi:uncharacterized protein YecT (DUF1311 family)
VRTRISALIIAAALVGAAAFAYADDNKEPNRECGVSTPEMVACIDEKTAYWDKRLNAVYPKALKLAEPKQREQLRKAQRLWVQYRDANCLYWDLGEGTIARIEAADCMYRMTKDRAEELEGAVERN